jgi:hypothetical protein
LTLGQAPTRAHLAPDEKVDWFRVIVEVCRYSHTHSTIAMACGTAKSTVQGWKQGATPRWDEGEKLIELWCQVTGNGRETVHRVGRYSYRA